MLESYQAQAIEAFVLRSTIPLIYELPGGTSTVLFGTGTLFTTHDRYFVITAAHPFWDDKIDGTRLGYPDKLIDGRTQTFGHMNILWPKDRRFDVALLDLKDPSALATLRRNWEFLSISSVTAPSPTRSTFLTGYPEKNKVGNESAWGVVPFTIYTDALPTIPEDALAPVTPGLDLFYRYGKEAETLAGATSATPNLKGTSGASVWQLRELVGTAIWTPEQTVRIVGVQSASAHSQYFRAINWWGVASLFAEIGILLSI